jgi:hypothetical protein
MSEITGKFIEAYFLACISSFEFYLDSLRKMSEVYNSGYTHHKEIVDAYEEGYNHARENFSKIMSSSGSNGFGPRPPNIYF